MSKASPTQAQIGSALRYYEASAISARVIRKSACHVSEVPPWRFLTPGTAAAQAAAEAATELGVTQPFAVLDMFWRMRRMLADEGVSE